MPALCLMTTSVQKPSSPAPLTSGCEAMICSTSEVPERRAFPTTNNGFVSLAHPSTRSQKRPASTPYQILYKLDASLALIAGRGSLEELVGSLIAFKGVGGKLAEIDPVLPHGKPERRLFGRPKGCPMQDHVPLPATARPLGSSSAVTRGVPSNPAQEGGDARHSQRCSRPP